MPEWLDIILRSLVSIIFLFVVTKVIGKRQLAQMTFFDYTVGIAIGEIAGFMATDTNAKVYHGIIAFIIYALFPISLAWLALKSKIVRNFVESRATVLVKNGKVMEDNLKKERLTSEELMEHLRLKNAFRLADVEFAMMEGNGQVSVLLKKQNQPLTPKHLGVTVAPETEPQTVIMDGTIMDEPLATIGFNRKWLMDELAKNAIPLENVYLGEVDANGQLYVDLYDDQIQVPKPQTTQLLHATLKKCQADLELYALTTQNKTNKLLYEQEAKRLQTVIDEVTPLLMR
jgi:uncharacterized membrane protein YcaP (DUF421 family)